MTAAAFFDLDKTIIAKSSTLAFGRPLFRAGFVDRRTLAKAAIAQLSYSAFGADHTQMETVRARLLEITRGWDAAELRRLAAESVEEVVAPLVYQEALELIGHHRESGRLVVLISSSPEEIVRPLAGYLGGIDEVVATRSKVGPDGRYTGELDFYAYGAAKVDAIVELAERDGIDLAASFAYSDSITDAPLLRSVGHPVAVNPDRELRQLAQAEGWEIRDFVRPVDLEGGSARRRASISGGVATVAVGAAVTVWLWSRRHQA
jgi:HAD superfamily hydrolase (TIGR01490 family)